MEGTVVVFLYFCHGGLLLSRLELSKRDATVCTAGY